MKLDEVAEALERIDPRVFFEKRKDPALVRLRAAANRLVHALKEQARDERRAHRVEASRGSDPTGEKKARRREERGARKAQDRALLDATGMRRSRRRALPGPGAPTKNVLHSARRCYVCKNDYREVDAYYDSLCPSCARLHKEKRAQTADLSGKTALVVGARLKIGYQVALKLLRAGAKVVATTRFADDARKRFAAEPDFPSFRERLEVRALDLIALPEVEKLAASLPAVHVYVHVAAQSIRRPPAFYAHLAQGSSDDPDFPRGQLDEDGQQVDLRPRNSWTLRLGEVATAELLETVCVGALAPFVLLNRLLPVLRASRPAHVVLVTAMEGKFVQDGKPSRHPHTNMAKAALNMLVRTSAQDLASEEVFLNAVDPGWVSNEHAHATRERLREQGLEPPLDAVDGAARILDPIFAFQGVAGTLWKDFKASTDW